jgi:hypothetical protein
MTKFGVLKRKGIISIRSRSTKVSLASEYEVIAISGNQLSTVSDLRHNYRH